MATKSKTTTTKTPAKKSKVVAIIVGQAVLRGKSNSTENPEICGLSFQGCDDQDICMEIAVPLSAANELKVDGIYDLNFKPGAVAGGPSFKVGYLNEILESPYYERLVIKGDNIRGDVKLKIRPEQEQFFFEEKEYTLSLTEAATEE